MFAPNRTQDGTTFLHRLPQLILALELRWCDFSGLRVLKGHDHDSDKDTFTLRKSWGEDAPHLETIFERQTPCVPLTNMIYASTKFGISRCDSLRSSMNLRGCHPVSQSLQPGLCDMAQTLTGFMIKVGSDLKCLGFIREHGSRGNRPFATGRFLQRGTSWNICEIPSAWSQGNAETRSKKNVVK